MVELSFAPATLVAFLLAMVRTTAWLTVTPPFAMAGMPMRVRTGLAAGLSILMADQVPTDAISLQIGGLVFAIAYQVFIGVALGFVVRLFFAAFETAGGLIDFASGLSIAAIYDPVTGSQNAPVARFYGLAATVFLFVGGGHLLILSGYMRTFDAAPLEGPSLDQLGRTLTEGAGIFMVAAIEIAFPLAAALLMTEVGLALLARAAPQANVLMLGLTLKAFVLLMLLGLAVGVLPWAVENVADQATRAALGLW